MNYSPYFIELVKSNNRKDWSDDSLKQVNGITLMFRHLMKPMILKKLMVDISKEMHLALETV